MGRMKWVVVGALLSAGVCASAEDIVFSARHIREVHGKYFPVDTFHLYRIGSNGTGLVRLTTGDWMDTDPCLAPDRKHVLFWRREKHDAARDIQLCSILPDGTGLKTIVRFDEIDLSDPIGLARALTSNRKYVVRSIKSRWDRSSFEIGIAGKKAKYREVLPKASPNGRYLWTESEANTGIIDLDSGKSTETEGIPSGAGGTMVPQQVTWLDDSTLFFSFYENPSLFGLATIKGTVQKATPIHKKVGKKRVDLPMFESTQWRQNPNASKAFRVGAGGGKILMQQVNRNESGGDPFIMCFSATTGESFFETKGRFLEDASRDLQTFLTTGWDWGKGFEMDGAVPKQNLAIWDIHTQRPTLLLGSEWSCQGACFVGNLDTVGVRK